MEIIVTLSIPLKDPRRAGLSLSVDDIRYGCVRISSSLGDGELEYSVECRGSPCAGTVKNMVNDILRCLRPLLEIERLSVSA